MRRFEDNVNEGVFSEVATVIVSVQLLSAIVYANLNVTNLPHAMSIFEISDCFAIGR